MAMDSFKLGLYSLLISGMLSVPIQAQTSSSPDGQPHDDRRSPAARFFSGMPKAQAKDAYLSNLLPPKQNEPSPQMKMEEQVNTLPLIGNYLSSFVGPIYAMRNDLQATRDMLKNYMYFPFLEIHGHRLYFFVGNFKFASPAQNDIKNLEFRLEVK